MSIEGFIKCEICHEWLPPQQIDIDWQDSGDNICHSCGKGKTADEEDRIEAIAGYFLNRIEALNETIGYLRSKAVA